MNNKVKDKYFYICGIPFKFLTFRGRAANCRIGDSRQLVFIPRKYFNNDGTLKCESKDLVWFINKESTMHKIRLAHKEDTNPDMNSQRRSW